MGILDADLSLYFPDYRSNEKTFQLITQVAGRAGREKTGQSHYADPTIHITMFLGLQNL